MATVDTPTTPTPAGAEPAPTPPTEEAARTRSTAPTEDAARSTAPTDVDAARSTAPVDAARRRPMTQKDPPLVQRSTALTEDAARTNTRHQHAPARSTKPRTTSKPRQRQPQQPGGAADVRTEKRNSNSLTDAFLHLFAPWLQNRVLFPYPLVFLGFWITIGVALLGVCTVIFRVTGCEDTDHCYTPTTGVGLQDLFTTSVNPVSPGFLCLHWTTSHLQPVPLRVLSDLAIEEERFSSGPQMHERFPNGTADLDVKNPMNIGTRIERCSPYVGGFLSILWQESSRGQELGGSVPPFCAGSSPKEYALAHNRTLPSCAKIDAGTAFAKSKLNTREQLLFADGIFFLCYRERRCPSLLDAFAKSISVAGLLFLVLLILMLFVLFWWHVWGHQQSLGANQEETAEGAAWTAKKKLAEFVAKVFPSVHDLQQRADRAEAERAVLSAEVDVFRTGWCVFLPSSLTPTQFFRKGCGEKRQTGAHSMRFGRWGGEDCVG